MCRWHHPGCSRRPHSGASPRVGPTLEGLGRLVSSRCRRRVSGRCWAGRLPAPRQRRRRVETAPWKAWVLSRGMILRQTERVRPWARLPRQLPWSLGFCSKQRKPRGASWKQVSCLLCTALGRRSARPQWRRRQQQEVTPTKRRVSLPCGLLFRRPCRRAATPMWSARCSISETRRAVGEQAFTQSAKFGGTTWRSIDFAEFSEFFLVFSLQKGVGKSENQARV